MFVSEVFPILICPDFLPTIEAKQLFVDFGRSRRHRRDYSELLYSSEPDWRNIAIALTDADFGEQTAHSCEKA